MKHIAIMATAAVFLGAPASGAAGFTDATSTHLPPQDPAKFTMAGAAADLDGDGDLDLALAREWAANAILINDGNGCFKDESNRIVPIRGDHEDVAAADFDGDGDIDLVFVGEDDQVYGYHLNDGEGHFIDVSGRLPRRGTSNAVAADDLDGDGDTDLYVGNNGQDFFFANDGRGVFADETATRLPAAMDVTQHVEPGDVDADGDLDLALGNEDGNQLLLNDGQGRFSFAPAASLPSTGTPEETRNAAFADVDGDGDLDLMFSNVRLFVKGADPQDRLLLNDGGGVFTDVTADALPRETLSTMWSASLDLDDDGDIDIVSGTIGDLSGRTSDAPVVALVNDGAGRFSAADVLPRTARGNVFDIVVADFDGDGFDDAFLASRGGLDRLLLQSAPTTACP